MPVLDVPGATRSAERRARAEDPHSRHRIPDVNLFTRVRYTM
jgi:hypothetical protein